MGDVDPDEIEMDQEALNILSALVDLEGNANSREVRDYLGEMDNGVFHYRIDEYLKPQDLVTTEMPDSKPGHFPAMEVSITDRGRAFVDEVDHAGGSESTVIRRVDRIEDRIESLEQENQRLKQRNEELKRAVDQTGVGGIEAELSSIKNDLRDVKSRVADVEQHPLVSSNNSTTAVNMGLILSNTSKDLLKETVGEEAVEDMEQQVRQQLDERGALLDE
jgi:hypothetical protein